MSSGYIIPSLDRAFVVLDVLAQAGRGLSLAELGRSCDVPKSTLFRILVTLQEHHCVIWNAEERSYRLGSKLWELGSHFLGNSDLYQLAAKPMRELAEDSRETVFLGQLEDGQVIYLRRMESPRSVMVVQKLSQRVPAHCTATGVAMLAYLREGEVDDILDRHGMEAFNAGTVTDRTQLKTRLAMVRRQGYSIVDGEYNQDVLCMSVPVFNHTHRPIAAITVAMLSSQRPTEDRIAAITAQIKQSARSLSIELGFRG